MSDTGARLTLVQPGAPAPQGKALAAHDDDELMLLARANVEGAFDVLVHRHQRRLLRVAARYLGRHGAAADVVQNTFLEIYRARARYQCRGRFQAYLYRVLLNECRMALRSVRRQRQETAIPADTVGLGESQILMRERQREVEAALGQLSEKLREVVLLRYSADLAYDEIAQVLGVPLGTVKRRLFDGMDKLRRNLGES